ncbi:MAG: hypothetical protein LBL48_06985 [Azoarcus sp.]|jgi:hypothetical protein|nr:hypothetical protein [Azoarcus sp.]
MKKLIFLLALLVSSFSFTAVSQEAEEKFVATQKIQGKAHCMNSHSH